MPRVLRGNKVYPTLVSKPKAKKTQQQPQPKEEFNLEPPKPAIRSILAPSANFVRSKPDDVDNEKMIERKYEEDNIVEDEDAEYGTTQVNNDESAAGTPDFAAIDFSKTDRSFQVGEVDYKELTEWLNMHPVAQIEMPTNDMAKWVGVFHTESNQKLYFPPYFNIGELMYVIMPEFPGTKNKQAFAGSMGVVCAYQCVQNFSIGVIKTALLNEDDDNDDEFVEKESYQILNFLKSTGKMNAVANCGIHFINLTAATVKEIKLPKQETFKQSFVLIEKMDLDLENLHKHNPKLMKDLNALRFIFRSLAEGLACMHLAKPKPIPHGDFKPQNVFCSPHTEQWLNLVLEHDKSLTKRKFIYVKIADFAASFPRVWDTTKEPSQELTLGYSSPQRIGLLKLKLNQATTQDDIWALGMVMLSISTFHEEFDKLVHYMEGLFDHVDPYFREESSAELVQKAVQQTLKNAKRDWRMNWKARAAIKNENTDQLQDLISKCLTVNEAERINIEQVLNHPFISDLETKYEKRI